MGLLLSAFAGCAALLFAAVGCADLLLGAVISSVISPEAGAIEDCAVGATDADDDEDEAEGHFDAKKYIEEVEGRKKSKDIEDSSDDSDSDGDASRIDSGSQDASPPEDSAKEYYQAPADHLSSDASSGPDGLIGLSHMVEMDGTEAEGDSIEKMAHARSPDEIMEKEEKWNLKFFLQNRAAKGLPVPVFDIKAELEAEERAKKAQERKSSRPSSRSGTQRSKASVAIEDDRTQRSKMKGSSSTPELPKIKPEDRIPEVSYLTRRIQYHRGQGGRIYADTPAWVNGQL